VDVREASDAAREDSQLGVHDALNISFKQMVLNAGEVLPHAMRLKKESKRVVLFSELGTHMDSCGLLGALLVDVLGFDAQLVCRLQGGCAAWSNWLEENKDDARTLEPLAMRLARIKRKQAQLVLQFRAERKEVTKSCTSDTTSSLGGWAAMAAAPDTMTCSAPYTDNNDEAKSAASGEHEEHTSPQTRQDCESENEMSGEQGNSIPHASTSSAAECDQRVEDVENPPLVFSPSSDICDNGSPEVGGCEKTMDDPPAEFQPDSECECVEASRQKLQQPHLARTNCSPRPAASPCRETASSRLAATCALA
jgi:hypothetical protein